MAPVAPCEPGLPDGPGLPTDPWAPCPPVGPYREKSETVYSLSARFLLFFAMLLTVHTNFVQYAMQ